MGVCMLTTAAAAKRDVRVRVINTGDEKERVVVVVVVVEVVEVVVS